MHIRRGIARTTAAIAEVPRNNSFFLTLFMAVSYTHLTLPTKA